MQIRAHLRARVQRVGQRVGVFSISTPTHWQISSTPSPGAPARARNRPHTLARRGSARAPQPAHPTVWPRSPHTLARRPIAWPLFSQSAREGRLKGRPRKRRGRRFETRTEYRRRRACSARLRVGWPQSAKYHGLSRTPAKSCGRGHRTFRSITGTATWNGGGMGDPDAVFGAAEVEWFFWGVGENHATAAPQGRKLFHAGPVASNAEGACPP